MQHFFVDPIQIQGSKITIIGSDVKHIRDVLRKKPGDEIAISNGMDDKEYRCRIESIGEEVICTLCFVKENGVELPSRVTLFQALPKADKMEYVIQKAVELGVYEIVPVAAARCVVKLDHQKEKQKIARWQGIAEAAAKQSGRAIIPNVKSVLNMKEACEYAKMFDVAFIPYEMAQDMNATKKMMESLKPGESICFLIGPEGGFEQSEIELAMGAGIEPITLGRRILRTETAGLTVLSWIMYQLEGKDIK